MHNQLQRAITLARKTGDRLIVYDLNRREEPFVVMSLSEYEKLVVEKSEVRGLTENELLDKINRDIAIWHSEQESRIETGKANNYNTERPTFERPREFSSVREIMDETDYITEALSKNEALRERNFDTNIGKRRNHWIIPEDRKEGAEEIIEEDRQYLEEI